MKKLFTLLLFFFSLTLLAQVNVKGYYRKDGTYVQPHVRSSPDGNPYNNYSYPGNYNPYTGKTAGGNPDTYLRNYYNRLYSTYSATAYSSLTGCLTTDFRGLKPHNSGAKIHDPDNNVIGHIQYLEDFTPNKIYDVDFMPIAYVETNKAGSRYSVFNVDGQLMRTTKNDSGTVATAIIVGIMVIAGAIGLSML